MSQANTQPEIKRIFGNILLIFAALTLPGIAWGLFGWMHLFLPMLVFLLVTRHGIHIGNRFVLAGVSLALIVGVATRTLDSLLFSFSLLPLGYMLAHSGMRGESPARSGLKGASIQTVTWIVLLFALGVIQDASPYGSIVETINGGIDEALAQYRGAGGLEPDVMIAIEATFYQAKRIIPIILPALFIGCTFFATWFTMAIGNRIALRVYQKRVWTRYRYWELPDRLIWLGIVCAGLAVLPIDGIRITSINILILLSIVYCFQGLSVCVFFMNKWNVPILFRSFIYVMVIFQSFGTLVLLIAGIADIWADFRKLHKSEEQHDDNH